MYWIGPLVVGLDVKKWDDSHERIIYKKSKQLNRDSDGGCLKKIIVDSNQKTMA